MNGITDEVERAIAAGLFYVAVAICLSLPDVCAALESSDGETTKAKYMRWYDEWLAHMYPGLTSEDIYSLRCGVVHQGRFGHPKMQYARVVFTTDDSKVRAHNNVISDALQLSATVFCRDAPPALIGDDDIIDLVAAAVDVETHVAIGMAAQPWMFVGSPAGAVRGALCVLRLASETHCRVTMKTRDPRVPAIDA